MIGIYDEDFPFVGSATELWHSLSIRNAKRLESKIKNITDMNELEAVMESSQKELSQLKVSILS